MKNNEIQLLINLREYMIHKYNSLDGRGNPGTSVILQKEVAGIIEESVRRLDQVLNEHVKIGK